MYKTQKTLDNSIAGWGPPDSPVWTRIKIFLPLTVTYLT